MKGFERPRFADQFVVVDDEYRRKPAGALLVAAYPSSDDRPSNIYRRSGNNQ